MPITRRPDYNVDVVVCIDGTGTMGQYIDYFKKNATSIFQKYIDEMNECGKNVQELRVKIIVFRDYAFDYDPMKESRFFDFDKDKDDLVRFINGIQAVGGGDEPENSLEALALAMKSDWTNKEAKEEKRRRHVIVLCTDASPLPLGERKGNYNYPFNIPSNMDELQEMWDNDMNHQAKRLIIMAPEESWNNDIYDWDKCYFIPLKNEESAFIEDIDLCINVVKTAI